MRLNRDADITLDLPEGHTAIVVALTGHVTVNGVQGAGEAEMVLLDREGGDIAIYADGDAKLLVLSGEPIDEPIVGHGPFVMNSEAEIRQAVDDFNSGRFAKFACLTTRTRPLDGWYVILGLVPRIPRRKDVWPACSAVSGQQDGGAGRFPGLEIAVGLGRFG